MLLLGHSPKHLNKKPSETKMYLVPCQTSMLELFVKLLNETCEGSN